MHLFLNHIIECFMQKTRGLYFSSLFSITKHKVNRATVCYVKFNRIVLSNVFNILCYFWQRPIKNWAFIFLGADFWVYFPEIFFQIKLLKWHCPKCSTNPIAVTPIWKLEFANGEHSIRGFYRIFFEKFIFKFSFAHKRFQMGQEMYFYELYKV